MPPESDWERLHPLSPLLRGGRFALAGAGIAAQNQVGRTRLPLPVYTGGFLALVALGTAVGWASWRRTRFRLAAGHLELHRGVFVRRRRRVPLARVESVDVLRPFVARIFGLAVLKVEAVSNDDSEVDLAYLPEVRAEALRARLLAERAGVAADTPPPPEIVLVTTPTSALVKTALVVPLVCTVLLTGASVVVGLLLAAEAGLGLWFTGAIMIITMTAGQLARLESAYATTVAEAPDGLRIRRGLLNLRSQTVPLARVQAVRIVEPLLWRRWDWVRLLVDVAGYRGGSRSETSQSAVLLPVAPRWLAASVVGRVFPGFDLGACPLVPAPAAARWRAPIGHRALGVAWLDTWAVTVSGRWRRVTDVVPHDKVQSLRVVQGPWQRSLGLATLHLDAAGGSVAAAARHRTLDDTLRLLAESRELQSRGSQVRNPTVGRGVTLT